MSLMTLPHIQGLADARQLVFAATARTMAPRTRLTVSQWAEKNRVLTSKNAAITGRWRNSRNPLQVEIMDCGSATSPVRDVVALLCIQFGKSEIELNILGYTMTENPMPVLLALPGEVSMNKIIDQKVAPMISTTEAIQQVMVSLASRESSNRRNFKDFEGGQLFIEHAGNPVRLKSTSAGLVLADEYSSFANAIGSGDDPGALLDGRTTAFVNAKRFKVGSPEVAGACRLTELWEKSDQRRWHIACPHCQHSQHLVWEGLMWTPDRKDVWYCCQANGCVIREHQKSRLIAEGGWVAANPDAHSRGYHANGLYYPIGQGLTWLELVEEYHGALSDEAKMQTFWKDRLALAFADKRGANLRAALLRDRTEAWKLRQAQPGVLAITAGVDTQDDRLEVQIVGWGRGLANWPLDYVALPGDPEEDAVWDALTDLLNRPIEHVSGALLRVESTAIDMGGHRTEAVKDYVRHGRIRRPMAIFGARNTNAPVLGKAKPADIKRNGKVEKHGVHIWQVGVTAIKNRLFGWLGGDAEREAAERRVHLSDELDDSYLGGLIAEVWDAAKGRYVKRRGAPRNEPLDTWGYAYAAANHPEVALHRFKEADWAAREKVIADQAAALGHRGRDEAAVVSGQAPVDVAAALAVPSEIFRSVVFELVRLAERQPHDAISDSQRHQWFNATCSDANETELLAILRANLQAAPTLAEAMRGDLLARCREYLAGQCDVLATSVKRKSTKPKRRRGTWVDGY